MVSQQYRAWSDCMDVQADLALYWWQRPIIFSVGRIRVNIKYVTLLQGGGDEHKERGDRD